jgi:hypothetical protein
MKQKKFFARMLAVTMTALAMALAGCATTVDIKVTNPPEWKVSEVKRIGIVAFKDGGYHAQIANNLTNKALEIVLGTERFTVITPDETQRLLRSNESLSAHMDAVLTGSVEGLGTTDLSSTSTSSDGKTTITYQRSATLTVMLRLERASDRSIINQKTVKASTRSGSAPSPAGLPSGTQLAQSIIERGQEGAPAQDSELSLSSLIRRASGSASASREAPPGILSGLARLIAPWTSVEKLTFQDDKAKDPQMKAALQALKGGNVKQALKIWTEVYEKTENTAAGYNAALATQASGDLVGAIQLMKKIYDDTGSASAGSELERMQTLAKNQNIVAEQYSGNDSRSTMDKVFAQAGDELKNVLTKNSKVAFFNTSRIQPDVVELSITELTKQFINELGVNVVDRSNTQLLQNEKQYQASGEVSDASAVSIGKALGVNTMIVSSVTGSGTLRRLNFKALSVETSRVLRLVAIPF